MPTVDSLTVLTPQWLQDAYGIRWDGVATRLGGKLAQVVRIRDQTTGEDLVVRQSDRNRIGRDRLLRIHRFQQHLSEHDVLTPLPRETSDQTTCAVHPASGQLIEVMPFMAGRHPNRGSREDAARAGEALARFHNAGVRYHDLPGEESCDQNHVALGRLERSVVAARRRLGGSALEALASRYLEDAEDAILGLEGMREELVETGLHLDASPGNIILGKGGQAWFLDCSHAARGRRVFDVVTAIYYHDLSSVAEFGDTRRFAPVDPELDSAFRDGYERVCEPVWKPAETRALLIERHLMLIHGVAYWSKALSEDAFEMVLTGFASQLDNLKVASRANSAPEGVPLDPPGRSG
jgi:Ser/Thr protein kinase RdoA (MazF antagonist)